MSEFSQLLDKLGRRNKGWSKAGPGRMKLFPIRVTSNIDGEMNKRLIAASNGNVSDKIRQYIEWGLENEE